MSEPVIIRPRSRFGRRLLNVLIVVAITVALLEVLLGLVDPLGLKYVYQLGFMNPYYVDTPGGYRLSPGDYQMGTWQAHVNNDLTRAVPDNGGGDCQVVFMGDSVTWGWAVNDDETYVNRVARQLEDVNVVNAGTIAYNSENVRTLMETLNGDLFVYLIIKNDNELSVIKGGNTPESGVRAYPGFGLLTGGESALASYQNYAIWLAATAPNPTSDARYYDDIAYFLDRGDAILVAFDHGLGSQTAEQYPINLLPLYSTSVSGSDAHPDANSHDYIANAMLPLVQTRLEETCV